MLSLLFSISGYVFGVSILGIARSAINLNVLLVCRYAEIHVSILSAMLTPSVDFTFVRRANRAKLPLRLLFLQFAEPLFVFEK